MTQPDTPERQTFLIGVDDNDTNVWPHAEEPDRMRSRGLAPCPKCGGSETWMQYCDACARRPFGADCRHGEPEHFHRGCRTCSYAWRTDDVIDAKVVCSK